jgi:hypothetical protein
VNANGLSFFRWLMAASFDCPLPATTLRTAKRAWEAGEDPSDWRAEKERAR